MRTPTPPRVLPTQPATRELLAATGMLRTWVVMDRIARALGL